MKLTDWRRLNYLYVENTSHLALRLEVPAGGTSFRYEKDSKLIASQNSDQADAELWWAGAKFSYKMYEII